MRRTIAAAALAAWLASCGVIPNSPSVRLTEGKGLIAAQGAFDAAVIAADDAVRAGAVAPVSAARIKVLADTGQGYLRAARAAYALGDTAGADAQTAALAALAGELAKLARSGPAEPTPTTESLP